MEHQDAYQYERARRFGVSVQGINYALRRLGVSYKKTLAHPKGTRRRTAYLSDHNKILRARYVVFSLDEEIQKPVQGCGSSLRCLTLSMCVRIIIPHITRVVPEDMYIETKAKTGCWRVKQPYSSLSRSLSQKNILLFQRHAYGASHAHYLLYWELDTVSILIYQCHIFWREDG